MNDLPEGQTQSYSQEEMLAAFSKSHGEFCNNRDLEYAKHEFTLGYTAALASQAEQVRKLEAQLKEYHADIPTLEHISDLEQQLAQANEKIVMKFSEERVPEFSQGFKSHELLESVTAEDCQRYVATIERQNETIAALQARVETADKQEPTTFLFGGMPVNSDVKFYLRPPITSERELELLAVIEQMREALAAIADPNSNHPIFFREGRVSGMSMERMYEEIANEALALTPDLSALDAYFKRRFDEVMAAAYPKGKP